MTYSLDFRKKVLLIRSTENLSFAKTEKRFGVSINSIFLWSKRLEAKRTKNRPAILGNPKYSLYKATSFLFVICVYFGVITQIFVKFRPGVVIYFMRV